MNFVTSYELRELIPKWVDEARKQMPHPQDIEFAHTYIDMKLSRTNANIGSITQGQWVDSKREFLRLLGGRFDKFIIVKKDGAAFQGFSSWDFFGSKATIWENPYGKMSSSPMEFQSVGAAREFITEHKQRFVGATVTKYRGAFIY